MNNRDTEWSLPVSAHSGNEVPMSAITAATKPIHTFAIEYMREQTVDDEDDDAHSHDINNVYRGYFARPSVQSPADGAGSSRSRIASAGKKYRSRLAVLKYGVCDSNIREIIW